MRLATCGVPLAVMAETEAYHARFELPALRAGLGQPQAIERAARMADEWNPLLDGALMAAYRRQQELAWTEHQVEHIETALEEAGCSPDRSGFRPWCSWTWWGTPG